MARQKRTQEAVQPLGFLCLRQLNWRGAQSLPSGLFSREFDRNAALAEIGLHQLAALTVALFKL
jgi:hypothetical protein